MSKPSRRPHRQNRPEKKRDRQRAAVEPEEIDSLIYIDNPGLLEISVCDDWWQRFLRESSHPS